MSTPGEYYRSLPPVSKAYGVICLMTTSAYYLGLCHPRSTLSLQYDLVLKHFQIWRFVTNFFFLGPFSFRFTIRLIMSYFRSLPPVSKAYGVICFMTTSAYYLGLCHPWNTLSLQYDLVFKHFQIWRLVTNFFFLGPFSFRFAIRLIMLARYGVLLEKGPFDKRTADFLWMMIFGALSLLAIAAVPMLWTSFMGVSLVFMIVYVWSREFPNARISIYGLVTLKGFYLPWALLALDLIFGDPLKPDILGMVAGHLYYFLTVLRPLAEGRNLLKTPLWVHKVVAFWGEGTQINSPVPPDPSAGVAFRGRSYRLGGR